MSWFSILPAYLTTLETWIVRFFLLLGGLTIGPWVLALVYDMVLYVFRAIIYEIPYYGGRAQGRRRPQAPTLTERPNGRKRAFSISSPVANGITGDEKEEAKRRSWDSNEGADLTEEESQAIRSTDLWDASTDSRFISRVDTAKKRR